MRPVKVVFFDAAGTLFEPRGSVGEIYAGHARRYGIEADPALLQSRFGRCFGEMAPLFAASGTEPARVIELEKEWWRELVGRVFEPYAPWPRFGEFFDEVYEAFAGREPWSLFPEVESVLIELRRRGLRLGVISNFDTRLLRLLESCGLREHFETVQIPTLAGAAKPSPEIFAAALSALGVGPAEAVHVGDHPSEDVEAALAAGLRAILLDHHRRFADNPRFTRVTGFGQLPDLDFLRGEGA